MTWVEVRSAIEHGYDRVLVPSVTVTEDRCPQMSAYPVTDLVVTAIEVHHNPVEPAYGGPEPLLTEIHRCDAHHTLGGHRPGLRGGRRRRCLRLSRLTIEHGVVS